MNSLKYSVPILLIAVFAALVCGCTTSQSAGSSAGTSSGDYILDITSSDPVWHTNPDGSCYYVSQIDVKNIGVNPAKNVMVRCNLNDESGNTIGTDSRYFEVIDAGDHKGFTVTIDGDCGGKGKYTVVAVATHGKQ
ncbi:MAG: hypothetical protein II861_00820 [Methanomicrobium sp.]|nr:hypothetical protein [Methanomicrobium sp.]